MHQPVKIHEESNRKLAWLEAILDSAKEVSLAVKTLPLSPPQANEHLQNAVASMLDLVSSLLDLSNIESGQFKLDSIDFDLPSVLGQALAKATPVAHVNKVNLSFRLAPDLPKTFAGDPRRLRDLIVHLLGDAVQYSQPGDISLAVISDPSNPLHLLFSLTGACMGTSSEQSESSPGATGLGLDYCRRLAQQLGAGLQVHSKPDGNRSIWFDVLLSSGSALTNGQDTGRVTVSKISVDQPASPPFQILIAEDSEDSRFLLQEFLKGGQYDLTFAENGREALEKARSQTFDLILMDIQMPVMDGLTATRLIRESEMQAGRTPVPLLALTGNARKADIELSLSAGCDAHILKPVSRLELLNAIQKYLRARTAPINAPEA